MYVPGRLINRRGELGSAVDACDPTRSRGSLYWVVFSEPSLNLPIRSVEMSISFDSPSTISSAMHTPTAGASLNPCPLNPVQMYSPSMPPHSSHNGVEVRRGRVQSGIAVGELAVLDAGDASRQP